MYLGYPIPYATLIQGIWDDHRAPIQSNCVFQVRIAFLEVLYILMVVIYWDLCWALIFMAATKDFRV